MGVIGIAVHVEPLSIQRVPDPGKHIAYSKVSQVSKCIGPRELNVPCRKLNEIERRRLKSDEYLNKIKLRVVPGACGTVVNAQ